MIPDYADFLLKSGILAAERSLQTSYVCHLVFLKELVDGINDFASVLVCSGQVTDYNVQYQGSCHGPQICREAQWCFTSSNVICKILSLLFIVFHPQEAAQVHYAGET